MESIYPHSLFLAFNIPPHPPPPIPTSQLYKLTDWTLKNCWDE